MTKSEVYINYTKYVMLYTMAVLLVAIFIPMDYWYFVFLRWSVMMASFYLVFSGYKLDRALLLLFVPIGILFNPVAPIYMSRESWLVFDWATLLFIGYSFWTMSRVKV